MAKLKLLGGGGWVGKALKPAAGGAVEKKGCMKVHLGDGGGLYQGGRL